MRGIVSERKNFCSKSSDPSMSTVTGVRLCDSDCRPWGMFGLYRQVYISLRFGWHRLLSSILCFCAKKAAPLAVFFIEYFNVVWCGYLCYVLQCIHYNILISFVCCCCFFLSYFCFVFLFLKYYLPFEVCHWYIFFLCPRIFWKFGQRFPSFRAISGAGN